MNHEAEATANGYSSLRVPELRALCKAQGLTTDGFKQVLVQRLDEHDQQEALLSLARDDDDDDEAVVCEVVEPEEEASTWQLGQSLLDALHGYSVEEQVLADVGMDLEDAGETAVLPEAEADTEPGLDADDAELQPAVEEAELEVEGEAAGQADIEFEPDAEMSIDASEMAVVEEQGNSSSSSAPPPVAPAAAGARRPMAVKSMQAPPAQSTVCGIEDTAQRPASDLRAVPVVLPSSQVPPLAPPPRKRALPSAAPGQEAKAAKATSVDSGLKGLAEQAVEARLVHSRLVARQDALTAQLEKVKEARCAKAEETRRLREQLRLLLIEEDRKTEELFAKVRLRTESWERKVGAAVSVGGPDRARPKSFQ